MGKVGFLSPCDFKELGVAKRSLSTTSARSALRQPWSIIARTNFLKAATNLNVVQPKLFQASRQDDLRFSDCTVSVIQILDDADGAVGSGGGYYGGGGGYYGGGCCQVAPPPCCQVYVPPPPPPPCCVYGGGYGGGGYGRGGYGRGGYGRGGYGRGGYRRGGYGRW